jgi:hypothetical protein
MKNKLSDLYNHLFETMETLKDAKPVSLETEIKRATAVRLTATAIIDAAKLEVGIRKLNKNIPQSAFFDVPTTELPKGSDEKKQLEKGEEQS